MSIEKDFGMVSHALNASDLFIDCGVASEEVFSDEPDDFRDTIVQRSVDLKRNSLEFNFHYLNPECLNRDVSTNIQQEVIRDVAEEYNNASPQHCQTSNAVLKLWNVSASEFLFIPCQLAELKPCSIADDRANSSATAPTSFEKPKIEKYNCDICDTHLNDLSSSLLHYERVHQLFKCPFCVKRFARSCQLRMHLFVHTNRREFVCNVCKKQFKRKRDLQQHVKRQHLTPVIPAEAFLCDSCGFQSKSKKSIRLHVLGHLGMTSFPCDMCNKQCKDQVDLTDHRNTHFGIKSYQCDVCKACYTRKEAMIKHRRTQHEGTYSFMCDICGRCFLHKSSLGVHLKVHTKENQIGCDICGKKMSGKIALLNHKKMHNQQRDFVCGICGMKYINKYSLQEHLLVHTGSNPFQCLLCDKSFFSRKKLLTHERIHDPLRTLYSCPNCEKSYISKFKLREHFGKHHRQA